MAAFTASTTELVQTLPTNNSRLLVGYDEALVRPPSRLASPSSSCCGASVACIIHHSSSKQHVPCRSKLDTLPVEIVDRILFHLIHPRCRLPGLTETQSGHDFTEKQKRGVKDQEDLTQPADTHRWAADIFSLHLIPHPFHALSLTSRRCHELVEGYCAHLVRQCNGTMFNLPFTHLDKYGSNCVYPDLSNIVYRRLWLQHAPRKCVHCSVVLDCYPFSRVKRLVTDCADCFYRQAMTVDEVERQYHLSPTAISAFHRIRGNPNSPWVLRVDVEALAFQLYNTRKFHDAHPEQFGRACSICAITRFTHQHGADMSSPNQRITVRQVSRRKASMRSHRS